MKLDEIKIERWQRFACEYEDVEDPMSLFEYILEPDGRDPYDDDRVGAIEQLEKEVQVLRSCTAALINILVESGNLDLEKVLKINHKYNTSFKVNGERV